MKRLSVLIFVLNAVLWANESASGTDIIPRTINFLIFVGLIWYLVGNRIVGFFQKRREEIAKRFQEVENRLREAKAKKEELEAKLEDAKIKANEIIEDAKKEAQLIYNNLIEEAKLEIERMEKIFEDYKETEKRKAEKEIVREFLQDILKDIHISSEEAAKLVLKVA
jgi:F-type H+-transporting ATPase subunit b